MACIAALIFGVIWLYRSPAFTVAAVDVLGAERLSQEQVLKLAALPSDVTLLRLPASDVERKLERNPWIAAAEVTRDFPDTVRIRVTERKPAAVIVTGPKTRWLVDASGVWLASLPASATPSLKPIRGVEGLDPVAGKRTQSETLLNALAIHARLSPTLAPKIKLISAPTIDKTALVTDSGVEVFVGTADDIGRKQQVAERILKEQAKKVVYINVRTVDRPTWRGLEQP